MSKLKKDITKEVQRNEFCYDHVQSSLQELDFVSQPSIEHCKFCIYGKSLMNLYLYKDCSATVRSYLAVLSQYISILIMM